MSDHYWLTEAQIECLKPCFPRAHGVPRVDDRWVISGIIHVIKRGLQWRDAPAEPSSPPPISLLLLCGA